MGLVEDFFLCEKCGSKDFEVIYNFSIRFHGVNFSEDLIYDRVNEANYQCKGCQRKFTKQEIEEGLAGLKKSRILR